MKLTGLITDVRVIGSGPDDDAVKDASRSLVRSDAVANADVKSEGVSRAHAAAGSWERTGIEKNIPSSHTISRRAASSRIAVSAPRSGDNSPRSHRDTVAWVVPVSSARAA